MQNQSLTIAFHTPNLNFRGSCVAVYDYARGIEEFMNHRAIILTDANQMTTNDDIAFKWISNRFPIFTYQSLNDLERILENNQCDILYCIKYGTNDRIYSEKVYTVIHCVFDMTEPHGDLYLAVSETLALKHGFPKTQSLPHMISMPIGNPNAHFRAELGIPDNALVFGRHGGKDTFNLEWAKSAISKIVRTHPDIYFVFMNAPEWDTHHRIIYLPATTDIETKQRFINTCDACIVPESMGHTHGYSISEFYTHKKPIICFNGNVWNRAHLDILGDDAIYFSNEEEFTNRILNFRDLSSGLKFEVGTGYFRFTPEKVMRLFQERIIQPYIETKK